MESALTPTSNGDELIVNGKCYRQINMANTQYYHLHSRINKGALVDRGTNGRICGDDVRIITKSDRMVDIQGIDNHQVVAIHIVSAGAVIRTQCGLAIITMHQYAYIGHGKTIHSSGQMETFGNSVNEKSMKVPGRKQSITTQYGFCIPLNIKSGLPYMTLRPYTDDEWDNLPNVILTSDLDWDPTILDNIIDDNDTWFDSVSNLQDDSVSNLFDLHGNYQHRYVVHNMCIDDPTL